MGKRARILLSEERKRRRWSQQYLADCLGATRLSISRWERGQTTPGLYWRTKLCDLFGKGPEELGLLDEQPVGGQIGAHLSEPERSTTSLLVTQQRVRLWRVPFLRNPFFTGRDDILHNLHATLHYEATTLFSQSCVLTGLGGIGKTQTAIEYAYRYGHNYSAVFWVSSETTESLVASFLALADLLDLPEKQEAEQHHVVAFALRWLNSHDRWLLIFDNVEEFELVRPFVPMAPGGSLLFITQHSALGISTYTLRLETMSAEASLHFLLHRAGLQEPAGSLAPEEENAARAIVAALDGLPLALDQAGTYIAETACSLSDYFRLFQSSPMRLLNEHIAHTAHPLSVAKTIGLAFERLEGNNPLAAQMLLVCAFFPTKDIPESIFLQGADQLACEEVVADPFAFQAAIKALRCVSLLHRDASTHTFSVHRLVQTVLRARLSAQEQALWQQRVLAALNVVRAHPGA